MSNRTPAENAAIRTAIRNLNHMAKPPDPFGYDNELEFALALVRKAGYEVGPRTQCIEARQVKPNDILYGERGRFLVTNIESYVRLVGEGTNFWIHKATDLLTIERS